MKQTMQLAIPEDWFRSAENPKNTNTNEQKDMQQSEKTNDLVNKNKEDTSDILRAEDHTQRDE